MQIPKSTSIKICGITNTDQAKAIAKMKVNAIGVIGVESSKRFVKESQRREIFHELSRQFPEIKRVWVVANMNEQDLSRGLMGKGIPNIIQLHGEESEEKCRSLRKAHPQFQWWKAIRIKTQKDLQKALGYSGKVDELLLDAWSSSSLGGTGHQIPLDWLKDFRIENPWWLAGGISAKCISEILQKIKPWGVDASSKLEIFPGIKDLNKVKLLVETIRSHNQTDI